MIPARLRRLGLRLVCTSAVVAIAACSSSDGGGRAEDEVTVTPSGTGDLATMTVHVPAGWSLDLPSDPGKHFELWLDDIRLAPEVPAQVPPTHGRWPTFKMLISGMAGTGQWEAIAPIEPHEQRAINLQVLKLIWTHTPHWWAEIVTPEAEGTAKLARKAPDGGLSFQWMRGVKYEFDGRNDLPIPVLAGSYQYWLAGSWLPPFAFEVPEGAGIVEVNAAYDRFLGTATVAFPARDGMPDVGPAKARVTCSGRAKDLERTADAGEVAVRVLLGRWDPTPCTYEANGFSSDIMLVPGAQVRAPLGRLNVDDVVLTDEPGVKVRGDYSVRRYFWAADGTGSWGPWQAKGRTATGLDVPPGKYQVQVAYVVHGHRKEQLLDAIVP